MSARHPIDANRINEIKTRIRHLPPSPWYGVRTYDRRYEIRDRSDEMIIDVVHSKGDEQFIMEFIAKAREDILDLIEAQSIDAKQLEACAERARIAEEKYERAHDCHGKMCGACISCLLGVINHLSGMERAEPKNRR